MNHRSEWADWLRAVDQLQPADPEALEAITALLGLQLRHDVPSVARTEKAKAPSRPRRDTPSEAGDPIMPETIAPRRLESALTPGNTARNPAPAWLAYAPQLEQREPSRAGESAPQLEPLFPPKTTRALLIDALATSRDSVEVDLREVIEVVSRGDVLGQLPRLRTASLVQGVQLLIDRAETMEPFAADQAILRAAVASVVGRDCTAVQYFEGNPLWGAGDGEKEDWPDYKPPAAGTPVVLLTDLGIARPPGILPVASAADWLEFAAILARARCPLLALVPYPSARWPADLSRAITIIQWDRATTNSVIRRAVGGGLRVARQG